MPFALLLAQVTPVQPLPKGTGLPPGADAQADTQAVLTTVQAVLDAVPKREHARLRPILLPGGTATVAFDRPDGTSGFRRMTWDEWIAGIKPTTDVWQEQQGMPAVEIDGGIAMVWAPYRFLVNGKLTHCGYNHYDLVRDQGQWKIANITWSQHRTGCEAQ